MESEKKGVFIRKGLVIPFSELHFSYALSSGPGGQNVNKNATKARLKWWPMESGAVQNSLSQADADRLYKRVKNALAEDGSIQTVSDRFRTRESNRADCCDKLAQRIRTWLKKPKKRVPSKPTRASKERRLKEKRRASEIKKQRRKPLKDE